mmetsp:Transcript_103853/g.293712  ORF Transcript_103853/g.293712 Transcript_103853/m.293712 type:complete len:680 (-) Transcript_103853:172-2211(-)
MLAGRHSAVPVRPAAVAPVAIGPLVVQTCSRAAWTPRSAGGVGLSPSPRLDVRSGRPPPSAAGSAVLRVVAGPPAVASGQRVQAEDPGHSAGLGAAALRAPRRSASSSSLSLSCQRCYSVGSLHEGTAQPVQGHGQLVCSSPMRASSMERSLSTASIRLPSPRDVGLQTPVFPMRSAVPSSASNGLTSCIAAVVKTTKVVAEERLVESPGRRSQETAGVGVSDCLADKKSLLHVPLNRLPQQPEVSSGQPDSFRGSTRTSLVAMMGRSMGPEGESHGVELPVEAKCTEQRAVEDRAPLEGGPAGGELDLESGPDAVGTEDCIQSEPGTPRSPLRRADMRSRSADPQEWGEHCEPYQNTVNHMMSPKSRFRHLYLDHEVRQRRWQVRFAEKCRQEEEEVRKQLQATCSQRAFERGSFQDWYEGRLGRYHGAERTRKEMQRSEAQRRAHEELAECSFSPQAARRRPPRRRASASCRRLQIGAKADEAPKVCPTATANRLVAEQALQIEALRKLDRQEQQQQHQAETAAAKDLESAIEESKRKLQCFMDTNEGRKYLAERAQNYMKLNQGIDQNTAMREAQDDLVRASEAKLRSQATALVRQRVQNDLQHIQLDRLKVARELIQLQRRCQSLIGKKDVPQSALQGFDMHLVDQLTSQAWYAKAREAATRILSSRTSPGSRRA